MFGGFRLLWRYEATPGPARKSESQWPAATAIELDRTLPTLVMFAHPRCPCTRASMEELATLMTHNQGRVAARVVFFQPEDADEQWSRTDLYETARAIPGVSVMLDKDNVEAGRFSAKTSGDTLLFDRHGKLLFSGGITAARGHVGDSDGSAALATLLEGRTPLVHDTPVFGCPLSAPEQD